MNCETEFKVCCDPQRLIRAREIARELKSDAPAMELRELLEAVLGLRSCRLQVSQKGLILIEDLAVKHCFGFAAGTYGLLVTPTPGLGDWADGTGIAVDADHPDALVNVYLGHDTESALAAKHAEECLGDEAFGEVLGIPPCCRRFYSNLTFNIPSSDFHFHWRSVVAHPQEIEVPAGANFLGRYFGRSFVSHFPCSVTCPATRQQTLSRFGLISAIDQQFAEHIAAAHYWSYLVTRKEGIVAYRSTLPASDGTSFDLKGALPLNRRRNGAPRWCRIRVQPDHITLQDTGGRLVDIETSHARFLRPRGEY